MARVLLDRSLAAEFFGSRDAVTLAANSLVALVEQLDGIGPGFAEIAQVRAAFAVDGVIVADWTVPLTADSEVYLLPRIGGGQGAAPHMAM